MSFVFFNVMPIISDPNPEISKTIGLALRTLRKRSFMSMEDVASGLGTTFQQIGKYESGHNRISLNTFIRFCDVIGISLSQAIEQFSFMQRAATKNQDNIEHTSYYSTMLAHFPNIKDEKMQYHFACLIKHYAKPEYTVKTTEDNPMENVENVR